MPKFKPFQSNRSVMDVFYYLVLGNKPKDIIHKLKQPQSTVSEKIRFLVKSKLIIKNKWNFQVNEDKLIEVFQNSVSSYLINFDVVFDSIKSTKKTHDGITKVMKLIPSIFNRERVNSIIFTYSDYYSEGWLKVRSIDDITQVYLDTLKIVEDKKYQKFKQDTKPLRDLLRSLNIRSMEEDFLIQSEKTLI